MKRLLFAGMLVLVTTAAQAQTTAADQYNHPEGAYTTLGPAGAGVYRESAPRDTHSTAGKVVSHRRTVGIRKPRAD